MQKSDIKIREEQKAGSTQARVGTAALGRPAESQLGPRHLALALLQLYKRWISPALPPSCRYVPTCSEYALEAVERYGALRGGLLATWRLLRCHPFAKGGLDPVVKKTPSSERHLTLSSQPEHHLTLSSRPERSAADGPCVFPRQHLDVNHSTKEMTSN
jgi:putative membrane protein insertion efficiency factor